MSEALLQNLLEHAKRAGADAADVLMATNTALEVKRRLGQTERLERTESSGVGLRVFVGQRSAITAANSLDPRGFAQLAERAVAMAKLVPADQWIGLTPRASLSGVIGLDLVDAVEPGAEELLKQASAADDAAMQVTGVTNSQGAEASFSRSDIALATSHGFYGEYSRTGHSISSVVVGGAGTEMQRDFDFTSAVHAGDMRTPEDVGRSAGERAVARLKPVRPATGRMPVIYDPRISNSLVGHLASGVNGAAIAAGGSFLKDSLKKRIFASGIRIVDDPRRVRGLRSSPFDSECVETTECVLVDDGVIATWLLDDRTGRQLGMQTTGHGRRGLGGQPSPTSSNLYLAAGVETPQALMSDIKEGVYLTELIGSGINMTTGDYSRGAAGFMIRDGALAEPIAEFTIAGTLQEIFAAMRPANDLQFLRGTDAPTIRVDGLMVAAA